MKGKQSILFLTAAVAGGNYYAMAMHLIAGIVVGRYVAPEVLGKFGAFGLVLGYVPFLQLGVLNGLNRELPYYIGKGDQTRVLSLASAGQFWACLIGGVIGLMLLGLSGWNVLSGNWENAVGWAVHAVLCFLIFYNTYYLQMTYRTSHDFARLAISKVFESTASVLLIVLVVWWGFYGLCLKALLVAMVSLGILFYWCPIRVHPKWNLMEIKHLFKIGCPIFVVGQVYAYWGVMLSTVLLTELGKEGLGLYAIVTMAMAAMDTIPVAIGQIVYPRMAQEWGRDPSVKSLIRVAYKPILYSFFGMIPCLIVATYCVDPAIRFLIPKYAGAVSATQWGIWIALISCLGPINNVFNVVRRQKLFFVAIALGIGATFIALKVLLFNQVSLVAFPQALLIGRTVFIVTCFICIWMIYGEQKARGVK